MKTFQPCSSSGMRDNDHKFYSRVTLIEWNGANVDLSNIIMRKKFETVEEADDFVRQYFLQRGCVEK